MDKKSRIKKNTVIQPPLTENAPPIQNSSDSPNSLNVQSSEKETIIPKLRTKEELILNIKEWIKIDAEITKLKAELKEKTTKQKQLTESLVVVMKTNAIDCFDINGGSLVYKQRKTKKSITGKFLLEQLEKYYKDQPEIAKEVTKNVLDNRIEVVKEEIKRKIKK
jgi:hypothetical protein